MISEKLGKVPEKAPGGRAWPADGPQAAHLGGGERLHRHPRAGQVQDGPGRRLAAGEAGGHQVAAGQPPVDRQLAAPRHLQAFGSKLKTCLLVC